MKKKQSLFTLIAVALLSVLVCSLSCSPQQIKENEKPEEPEPDPQTEPQPQPQEPDYFSGGAGTEADPFLISTAFDLEYLTEMTNDADSISRYIAAHYLQTADIDLSHSTRFLPIGQEVRPFRGVYDGGGHKILNLNVVSSKTRPSGLFSSITGSAIRNIVFENVDIDCSYPFCGTAVGKAVSSVIENISVSGNFRQWSIYSAGGISNAGFSGGVVGYAQDSEVKSCSFSGAVTVYGSRSGGILGYLKGGSLEDCHVLPGSVLSLYCESQGGIVGYCEGTANTVSNCSFEGELTSYGKAQGGIVGEFTGGTISNCVSGSFTQQGNDQEMSGGIVGRIVASGNVAVNNCAAYSRVQGAWAVGGIAGYVSAGGASVTISDCAYTYGELLSTGASGINLAPTGGIIGWADGSGQIEISNCFSSPFVIRAGSTRSTSTPQGIIGLNTNSAGVAVSGCLSSVADAFVPSPGTEADVEAAISGISGLPADPHVKARAKRRVSVIGDSISTFQGWMPSGFVAHYPTANGVLTNVKDMWWYKVIYDYMDEATLDTNLSFGGSHFTNTTDENYGKKFTYTEFWANHSAVENFVDYGGLGRPNVVFIFSGTNDYIHDIDPLYPGSATVRSAPVVSDAALSSIYAKADAVVSAEEALALPDGTFCETFAKIVNMLLQYYPGVKMVFIIPDGYSASMQASSVKMAEHYGMKVIDLLDVDGFRANLHLPTMDGVHYTPEGMDFVARKINEEIGSWLNQ